MKIKAKVWQHGRPEEEHSQVLVDSALELTHEHASRRCAEHFCEVACSESDLHEADFPLDLMVRVEGKGPIAVRVHARFEPQFYADVVES